MTKPKTKMVKLVIDPCYGQSYGQIDQCEFCWLVDPCEREFNNMKKKEREEKRKLKLRRN